MRATVLFFALAACGTPSDPTEGADTDTAPVATALASCAYVNTFSGDPECKEYAGAGWTLQTADEDCQAPFIGADPGVLTEGVACDRTTILGTCTLEAGTDAEVVLVFPGDDPGACSGASLGCGFGNGTFEPSEVCEGTDAPPTSGAGVFQPFEQVCAEPLPDEGAGEGTDGDVCTWEAISACTEPDRAYVDYASCDPVVTQRPYVPLPVTYDTPSDDPRLSDTAYMAELSWVTSQVEACACICCHSSEESPDGASGWYLEAGPLWIDTVDDDGLAMLAGWVNSEAFGAFDPADNNGFDRSTTGLPTSDVDRMVAFLEGELARRGTDRDDFAATPPFGGPLYDQIVYEPEPCTGTQGVDAEGQVTWTGGDARYVYVLEADARSPGVPPNLDLPDGTVWRVDVDPDDDAIASPIAYGAGVPGAQVVFPAAGAPAPLTPGEAYYLYVLRDIYQPLTRCLFTAP